MTDRDQNPGPLMTTVISSIAGGGAMQVGSVATARLLNWASKKKKKGRKKNPDVDGRLSNPADIRKLKAKLLR